MAHTGKFGNAGDAGNFSCAQCEAAIYDVIDAGDTIDTALSAEIRQAMEMHLAGCEACSRIYAEAKRGQAWLDMLRRQRPEPPLSLAAKIISQTSGNPKTALVPMVPLAPIAPLAPTIAGAGNMLAMHLVPARHSSVLPSFATLRGILYQPRLAMTAAMAFFSISLTLNLTGVKLGDLKMADLKPGNLQHRFYEADAEIVRYYDNLRLVNEVQSSLDQMRGNLTVTPAEDEQAPDGNAPQQQQQPAPKGSSQRELPVDHHNAENMPGIAPLDHNDFDPLKGNDFERNQA